MGDNRFVWRKLGRGLSLVALLPALSLAGSFTYTNTTPNLCLPDLDTFDWGDCFNYDMTVFASSITTSLAADTTLGASTASLRTDLTTETARATAAEALRVLKAGDTMTGQLAISATGYNINLSSGMQFIAPRTGIKYADGSISTTAANGLNGLVIDSQALLSTAAISMGKFGDDRVLISSNAITGKLGDDKLSVSTGAFPGGFNAANQLVQLDSNGNLPSPFAKFGYVCDTMTATGSTSSTTLSAQPSNADALNVYVDGLRQVKGTDYTFNAATLLVTFAVAPTADSSGVNLCYSTGVVAGSPSTVYASQTSSNSFTAYNSFTKPTVFSSVTYLTGVTDASNAPAGTVGELKETGFTSVTLAANGFYADVGSIALTAGDWDISVFGRASAGSGAVIQYIWGIGTTSGNNGNFISFGETACENSHPTALPDDVSCGVPAYRYNTLGPITFYFKVYAIYSGTAPTFQGNMRARRVR